MQLYCGENMLKTAIISLVVLVASFATAQSVESKLYQEIETSFEKDGINIQLV